MKMFDDEEGLTVEKSVIGAVGIWFREGEYTSATTKDEKSGNLGSVQ